MNKEFMTFYWSQSCRGKGACLTQWSYEPCCAGPPNTEGSWWTFLTKHGPLEEGMAKHSGILAARTPWTVWKGKKIWHQKMSIPPCPGQMTSNMLLEKSRDIAPERMKWHSVVDVSGGESKVWCCKEQYWIGTWNVRSMNQGKLDMVK